MRESTLSYEVEPEVVRRRDRIFLQPVLPRPFPL
jgi:hypothetical protein